MVRHYRHLIGVYKIGEIEKAIEHAKSQFDLLNKAGGLLKTPPDRVEIHVYLVDDVKED